MKKLGTVTEKPGTIQRGWFDLFELPNGQMERLPVVIASGKKEGPTFLVTANIHGGEVVGLVVLHRFFEKLNLDELSGRIVAIPSLNPSGLLLGTRTPAWEAVDPNRKWPDGRPGREKKPLDKNDWLDEWAQLEHQPGPQERAWTKLFEAFREVGADFHVDLHSFTPGSIPFLFLDRFFYKSSPTEVEALAKKTESFVDAIGFSVFAEVSPANILKTEMWRTTTGAILNGLKIPAATLELGPTNAVNPENRDAAVEGLFNVLRWAKMIAGAPVPLQGIKVVKPKERYRMMSYPVAPCAGIADVRVNPGETFKKGDVLAVMRKIDGEPLTEVRADFDGVVVGWRLGVAKLPGQNLGWTAAPDRIPLVAPWPN